MITYRYFKLIRVKNTCPTISTTCTTDRGNLQLGNPLCPKRKGYQANHMISFIIPAVTPAVTTAISPIKHPPLPIFSDLRSCFANNEIDHNPNPKGPGHVGNRKGNPGDEKSNKVFLVALETPNQRTEFQSRENEKHAKH